MVLLCCLHFRKSWCLSVRSLPGREAKLPWQQTEWRSTTPLPRWLKLAQRTGRSTSSGTTCSTLPGISRIRSLAWASTAVSSSRLSTWVVCYSCPLSVVWRWRRPLCLLADVPLIYPVCRPFCLAVPDTSVQMWLIYLVCCPFWLALPDTAVSLQMYLWYILFVVLFVWRCRIPLFPSRCTADISCLLSFLSGFAGYCCVPVQYTSDIFCYLSFVCCLAFPDTSVSPCRCTMRAMSVFNCLLLVYSLLSDMSEYCCVVIAMQLLNRLKMITCQ